MYGTWSLKTAEMYGMEQKSELEFPLQQIMNTFACKADIAQIDTSYCTFNLPPEFTYIGYFQWVLVAF